MIRYLILFSFLCNCNISKVSKSVGNHKIDNDYFVVTKYINIKNCATSTKLFFKIIDLKHKIVPIYYNGYYDSNRHITKTKCLSYYNKNMGNVITVPIHKKLLKQNNLKGVFYLEGYLSDNEISLKDLLNMKNDSINMVKLSKYDCDDFIEKEEPVEE